MNPYSIQPVPASARVNIQPRRSLNKPSVIITDYNWGTAPAESDAPGHPLRDHTAPGTPSAPRCGAARGSQAARPPPLRARPRAGLRLLPWAAGPCPAPRPSRTHPWVQLARPGPSAAPRPRSGSRPYLSAPRPARISPTPCPGSTGDYACIAFLLLALTLLPAVPVTLAPTQNQLLCWRIEGLSRGSQPQTTARWGPGATGAKALGGPGVAAAAERCQWGAGGTGAPEAAARDSPAAATWLNFCSLPIVHEAPCQKGLSSVNPVEAGRGLKLRSLLFSNFGTSEKWSSVGVCFSFNKFEVLIQMVHSLTPPVSLV
ncbi:sterile alpha motif domain-containing protein 1-like [Poecile atricapillus]|uniref:sterile alpha motif domain-containing protein 1-like n=1 Tax=Poecile atricapillus TaxID=48891 RepID=UPI00273A30A8|nr:sterile alpha motif domain-containing protein 1-like [Poecile atricapillus]